MSNLGIGGVVLLSSVTAGLLALLALRRKFMTRLDALDGKLREPDGARELRSDLPAEVVALAARLGATADRATANHTAANRTAANHTTADRAAAHRAAPDRAPDFTTFEQSGQMWREPGGKPMAFRARQTIRVDAPGFLWRATMGPIVVADYFVAGTGGLEVMLLGALPISRMVGTAAVNRGEVLRYLAELPWCPDAILLNRSLDWKVVDANTIEVATGTGAARGTVTLALDGDGLIAAAAAASRPYAEANGRTTEYPWRGRFWDYQHIGHQFIPTQGEVAWGLPAGDFVYWRGRHLGR